MLLSQFLLILLSAFLHALWNYFAKKAPQRLEILALGFCYASLLFLPGLFWETEIPSLWGCALTVVTGILQVAYVVLLYRAYEYANLTLVYPLTRGIGVLGTFILELYFFEHLGNKIEILGILVVAVGTSCLAAPSLQQKEKKGVYYSLLTGILLSLAFIMGRLSKEHVQPFAYLWGMYITSAICLLPLLGKKPFTLLNEANHSYRMTALIIGVGSFLSYFFAVLVFRQIPVATVISVRELSVVMGAMMGFYFLKEKMTPLKVVSILLIVFGAILLKFR